ncbi:HAD-IA family hydrolase [Candidatus Saccharibacteria bacterium]|nr:HAD-IA family hydrolase [Candidatus Saccharibacteria bacterium]
MDEKGLGRRLQAVRREKGLTQQALCDGAGISYSTLTKIERGAIKAPSIFTVMKMAEIMGVTLDELLGSVSPSLPSRRLGRTKSGVSFVFFDINGCLIRSTQRGFVRLAEETNSLPDVVETAYLNYSDDADRGTLSMSDFDTKLAQRLHALVDWQKIYLESVEVIQPMQDLISWASEHYRVGLLTNSKPGLVPALRERNLIPNLNYDVIVDSSEVGLIKPERAIYEKAQEWAGCEPGEILFVDDTRTNLFPAAELGWHVMQFDGYDPEGSTNNVRKALEPSS